MNEENSFLKNIIIFYSRLSRNGKHLRIISRKGCKTGADRYYLSSVSTNMRKLQVCHSIDSEIWVLPKRKTIGFVWVEFNRGNEPIEGEHRGNFPLFQRQCQDKVYSAIILEGGGRRPWWKMVIRCVLTAKAINGFQRKEQQLSRRQCWQ